MTGWPDLLSLAALAATSYGFGLLGGFCWGRYGWRGRVPLPTIFRRRRPVDIWPPEEVNMLGARIDEHNPFEAPARGVTLH